MKRNTVITTVVLIALFGAIIFTLAKNKKEVESQKQLKTDVSEIATTTALAEMKETNSILNLVGTAMPDKEVTVASESAGKIVQLNFKIGDFVNKGTVLAKIDDTYKRLSLENAQLNYNKYKEDYERFQVLRKGDAVSETQLRDMKVAYENASIQLENAKKQLEDTKVVAPFSGFITSKNTELGAYVNVNTAIAGIADIAQLKVTLAVSESNAYLLRAGQQVNVRTDVYPGVVYKGTIANISPKGSSAHTYPIEIMIANNAKNPLKAGTYLNVEVNTGKTGKALMIPRDAIVSTVKDPSVYVVNNGIAHLSKITTGQDYNSYLEVTSGLKEGDQVVTSGQINLADGAKVSIIKN